jgi:hypothetical protein
MTDGGLDVVYAHEEDECLGMSTSQIKSINLITEMDQRTRT